LHVAQLSFQLDNERRAPEQLLRDWYSLPYVADAAAAGRNRVSVVQACVHRSHLRRGNVDYYFVPPDGTNSFGDGEFADTIEKLGADVFHVHGLGFTRDVIALNERMPSVPILLQDHADRVPPFWRRAQWRRAFAAVRGIAFCAKEQSQPFASAGLLPDNVEIFEISQWSAPFTPGEQDAARTATGLHGDPCILWVGHLSENKDPLTVLEGVSRAVERLPGLQLWCCYGRAPLLARVQARIDSDSLLRGRVHLLGEVPHDNMEAMMRAADLFVLGSHSEGSGCAMIEAMACGLPPVVTDIPSFRSLTGQGVAGFLWPPGDARQCASALLAAAAQPRADARAATRAHFQATASVAALGRQFDSLYRRMRRTA
jgi:glycosyltransferase involved in cell wall biosynthesis